MFTLGMTGLISAYVLIALLLLSLNLYSRISWKLKAASIILVTGFYIVTYLSIPQLLGWPTSTAPPERFRLVATDVLQPDKETGRKGLIFLWLKDLDDLSATGKPRGYELPYSDALYELVIKAKSKMEKGIPQLGEFKKPDDTNVRLVEDVNRLGQESYNIEFYDLPDPLIPEK